MNDNEEREYNDIESLAAYLHSGKMQALKAAEERARERLEGKEHDLDLVRAESALKRSLARQKVVALHN